jgi:hypothetical protein
MNFYHAVRTSNLMKIIFKNAEKARNLGTTMTDQNIAHDKIKSRLSFVQNPLFSRLDLSETQRLKDKNAILPVCMGAKLGP